MVLDKNFMRDARQNQVHCEFSNSAGLSGHPFSALDRIEPYGEGGKYKLIFSGKAKLVGPILFADAPQGAMQGPRYTTLKKLMAATKLTDLWDKK